MKTQIIASTLIAIAAIGSGTAFADEGNYKAGPIFKSTLSRLQVQSETQKAIKDGTLQIIGDTGPALTFTSIASRAKVRDEAVQSVRSHTVLVDQLGS